MTLLDNTPNPPSLQSALDTMRQLQGDLRAIRARGARPIAMKITPELVQIAEVAYPVMYDIKTGEPVPIPSIYGVPFTMVAELPDGLLYTIETDR